MDRQELENQLTLITAITPDGVITMKDGVAIVSHTDTANVSVVYNVFKLPFADGQYGVDFEKLLSLIKAYKTKEIDIALTEKMISLRSGSIKNRIQSLNVSVMPKVRPKMETPLPCIVEIETAEILEVVSFVEKVSDTSKNDYLGAGFVFDGTNLSFECLDADDTKRTFEIAQVLAGSGTKYQSLYPFDYLRTIVKAIGKVNGKGKMKISIGNNTPCRIESDDVTYVIANRMEGDD